MCNDNNCPGHVDSLDWSSQFKTFINGTAPPPSNINYNTSANNDSNNTTPSNAPSCQPLMSPFKPNERPKAFSTNAKKTAWDLKEKKRRIRWVDKLKDATSNIAPPPNNDNNQLTNANTHP